MKTYKFFFFLLSFSLSFNLWAEWKIPETQYTKAGEKLKTSDLENPKGLTIIAEENAFDKELKRRAKENAQGDGRRGVPSNPSYMPSLPTDNNFLRDPAKIKPPQK